MTEGFRINKVGDLRESWKGFHPSTRKSYQVLAVCRCAGLQGASRSAKHLDGAVTESRALVLSGE